MSEEEIKNLDDMNSIFYMGVHSKLKKAVRAHVFSTIEDDTLVVTISVRERNLNFTYKEDGISNKILNGLTAKTAFDRIYHRYKAYVLNQYFYPKEDHK